MRDCVGSSYLCYLKKIMLHVITKDKSETMYITDCSAGWSFLYKQGVRIKRLSYILNVIIGLIGPISNKRTFDTRRIDFHIHQLDKLFWFPQIFKKEKY